MRALGILCVVVIVGCGDGAEGTMQGDDDDDGGGPKPPEPAWRIDVDMSALDRFVTGGATTWTVAGVATASLGLAGVDVAGAATAAGGDGAFSAEVSVAGPGLTVVPVLARDVDGHERQAHRTLLSAPLYRPEGELARGAAGLVLTDAVLAAMAGSLGQSAGDIDVAGEILMRDVLSVDDRCVTWPVAAQQQPAEIALELDGATLWLKVRVPELYVYFEGTCQGLISQIPIAGEMAMDIDVWTRLTPNPSDACVVGFQHTPPQVFLPGFYFDVWGTSGPLQGWLVELSSSGKAQEAHDTFRSEFAGQADELLGDRLAGLTVFDRNETMELLGQAVDVHLCLTALEPAGGGLVARIGAQAVAQAPGARTAPGAPQLGGPVASPGPGELLLDADMVGQLLYSSWIGGGLARAGVQQVELSLLTLLVPELDGIYPADAVVDVAIDGELPPVVTVSPEPDADLRVDIGDLMLTLSVGDDVLFRLGARVTLDLDLVPMDGGLVPTVVRSTSEVHLLDEVADAPDLALEDAVNLKLADSAASLLGGATLTLPEIPGLGAPVSVTPDAGGRYLRIFLQ